MCAGERNAVSIICLTGARLGVVGNEVALTAGANSCLVKIGCKRVGASPGTLCAVADSHAGETRTKVNLGKIGLGEVQMRARQPISRFRCSSVSANAGQPIWNIDCWDGLPSKEHAEGIHQLLHLSKLQEERPVEWVVQATNPTGARTNKTSYHMAGVR